MAASDQIRLQWITPDCAKLTKLKALVIGRSGIGKTSLLRTIPPEEKVFTVSAEGGLITVRDLVDSGRVVGAMAKTFLEFTEIARRLGTEWAGKFSWVFVDSLTEAANLCYEKHKVAENGNDFGRSASKYYTDLYVTIKKYLDLPDCHTVFTALETETDLKDKKMTVPLVPSKTMQIRMPGLFDEVWLMEMDMSVKPPRRVFRTSAKLADSKDRTQVLADTEPALLGYIRNKIFNTQLKGDN